MATRSRAASARPLYLVHGADGYRARLRARRLALSLASGDGEAAADPDTPPAREELAGVTRLLGSAAGADDVLMATRSQGLFDAPDRPRVVLVEEAQKIGEPERLREMAPDAAVVLLMESAPAARAGEARGGASAPETRATSLAKLVRELGGTVEELRPLEEGAVDAWLERRAAALGLALAPDARLELARAVGSDLERAEGELRKLAAYAGGERLGHQAVRDLVTGAIASDVFALTGAVVRRDVRRAVGVLETLLERGEAPQRVVGLLLWQFRVLLVASSARNEDDLDRAVAHTRLSKPALWRARKDAPPITRTQAARAFEALYAADMAIKTGRADARTALLLLVLDLCGVEGADLRSLAERRPAL